MANVRLAMAAVAAGLAVIAVYYSIALAATPFLAFTVVLYLAWVQNGLLILMVGGLISAQTYFLLAARERGCLLRREQITGSSSSTVSVFAALLTLTNVGCCGLLSFWLALLVGTSLTTILIRLSPSLTWITLGLMILSTGFAAVRWRRISRSHSWKLATKEA